MERELTDFKGYIINDSGDNEKTLFSKRFNKWVKPIMKSTGYYEFHLYQKCKRTHKTIHRLIAETFIPNPENLPCVDHINGDKTDNRVENLRWCTSKDNNNYDVYISRKQNHPNLSKKVYQYTENNILIKIWASTMEAQRNGFDNTKISRCCLGKQKTHKGYKWSYKPL